MKKVVEIFAESEKETEKLGELFGKTILSSSLEGPFVIGLVGDLGAGKTVFVRGLAKAIGIKENITSPTFVIMNHYHGEKRDLFHFDCFRVKEVSSLGLSKIVEDHRNIVVLEWFDNIPPELKSTFLIKITLQKDKSRKFTFYE